LSNLGRKETVRKTNFFKVKIHSFYGERIGKQRIGNLSEYPNIAGEKQFLLGKKIQNNTVTRVKSHYCRRAM